MLRAMGRILAAGLLLVAGGANAQVVVSQVYGGGGNSGATLRSDFIELHNNGTTAVNLTGWSVQYAGSTGTTWTRTNLTGTIQAGGYFLVKQADGTGGTVNLPTPDVTGTIAMSATAGKVALVNNQTTLTGACPSSTSIIDLVGFGTGTNCSEGTPTAAPSNTTAVIRASNGCTDTGNNNADFATGTPNPRNSASAVAVCGVSTPLLSVNDVSAFEGDSGTTPFFFTFSLSQPAGVGGVSITYATADGTASAGSDYASTSGTATIPEGSSSVSISVDVFGDTAPEADETFTVNISSATGATIARASATGAIRNDDVAVVPINAIQSSGLTSPLNGTIVTTEGIVTAQKFNNGFFLQTADASVDANPNTSEGIFVFTSTAPPATATVGNRVRVTGTVTEFTPSTNLNQLSITEIVSVTAIQVISSGDQLPAPIALTTSDFGPSSDVTTAEKYEGMRVSVASARVVEPSDGNITESSATSSTTGVFQVVLPTVARPFREPGIGVLDVIPIPGGKTPPRFDTNPEKLMVRSRGQVGGTALTLEADTTINGMVGVLDYFSGDWALLPDPTATITTSGGKTATAVPDARYEDVTIGAFNLQRFFDDLNDSNGAPTLQSAAYDKRLTKASLAICDYLKAPDILGVVEMENLRVLGQLADRINATCARAPAYVPYLVQGNDVGGINVGWLVSNRSLGAVNRVEVVEVTQYGKTTTFNNPDSSTSLLNDRPPLLLRAIVRQNNGASYPVTAIINHLRSLSGIDSTAAGSNGWPTDGERIRNKRAQQAVFLANLVQSLQTANPNERIVLLGDFNAFEFNDGYADVMGIIRGNAAAEPQVLTYFPSPVTTPLTEGNTLTSNPDERYSYVFDGNAQTLDHALINSAMLSTAAAVEVDHARINADFGVHNYGIAGSPLRISDHDPVRVRISLAEFRSADLGTSASTSTPNVQLGGTASFSATASNAGPNDAASASIALVFNALVTPSVTAPAGWTCAAPVQNAGTTTVTCTTPSFASGGNAAFSATVATNAPGTLQMAVAVASQVTDPANGNNQASASVTVSAGNADMSSNLLGGPVVGGSITVGPRVQAGGGITYVVPVRNIGPNAAINPRVVLSADAPVANASLAATEAGWTCANNATASGFEIVCDLNGTLRTRGVAYFTLNITAPSRSGTLTIRSTASSTNPDPVTTNNTVTKVLQIVP